MIALIVGFGVLAVVFVILGILAAIFEWGEYTCVQIPMWIFAGVFVLAFLITGGKAFQAENEAVMFNDRYETTYTTEQVFWSRAAIFKVLEGSRQRIDGDLNINMD